jgi:hypothetical protein
MLDDGIYTSVSDIGDAENISKSYVSRILRLALLALDIVETILIGSTDPGMMEQLEGPLPLNWEEQRRKILPTADDLSYPRPAKLGGLATPHSFLG